ncbi:MAG: ribonuclease J [Acidimicrobiales bacterium]
MPSQVRVSFLGGLGEIGRNCAAVEVDGRIMLIDCGLMFPDDDMAGIDLVLPDFTWLKENKHRVEGVVATHGHEDHIGALSFLLEEMPLKIIGSPLTIGLAKNRIGEKGLLKQAEFIEVSDNDRIKVGPFDLEFFPVTHSVPHGFATAFHTPQGVILHSGDFKLDMTPVDGRLTDLAGIGHLAKDDGIRLFLCDSTNVESPGFSDSETSIGQSISDLFMQREGRRIVVACFASHIHRVQQVADAAIANGRIVATLGRSMNNNVALARQMGLLRIPDTHLRDIADVGDIPDEKLCVICTGSQANRCRHWSHGNRRQPVPFDERWRLCHLVVSPYPRKRVERVLRYRWAHPPWRRSRPLGNGSGARHWSRQGRRTPSDALDRAARVVRSCPW